ncbi:DUF192 domain-containing protein [Mesobacterium sp. TK19101]|uniref:DUF192 domain-containing protein n=1 Tax=Mesobacterium hydrothermale TaxID=3111907 RepID=A0ABU6HDI1_9RHOB|nr:DUF192 domain-containing protein [Mesobacterium sp. TK19101]MEC3860519.1 DUF192 domain-containing protein [Mesobacterium sp. TK19101]
MGKCHRLIASVCVALALAAGSARADCQGDRVSLRGDWGSASFSAEIAGTSEERAKGLMFRETMPRFSGMLFVYDSPRQVAFWMRNTLIPLDMIFADARGVVQRVHANARPLDETPIPGGPGIQYVLEINGGMAALLGIDAGSQLQHPAIDQALAAWSCDPS